MDYCGTANVIRVRSGAGTSKQNLGGININKYENPKIIVIITKYYPHRHAASISPLVIGSRMPNAPCIY